MSSYKICPAHERAIDEYARSFPPAVETAYAASKYLVAIATDETTPTGRLECPACAIGKDGEPFEDGDYACLRAVRCALPPDQVPLDQTLTRVDKLSDAEGGPPWDGFVRITWGADHFGGDRFRRLPETKEEPIRLEIVTRDHRGNPLPPLVLENVQRTGKPRTGKHLRFVLTQIARGVYKLAPSVNVPGKLRGFITIVDEEEG
jgi:hypothetical protein